MSRRAAPASTLATALLLAAAMLTPGAASAQTVVGTALEFGLLATWAADCTQPPGKSNIHSTYVAKDGEVLNLHDAGPTFLEDKYVVRAAKPAGADLLTIQTLSVQGLMATITLRRIGDKMQIWRVVAPNNSVPVNNGRFTANDAVIPALSRCK